MLGKTGERVWTGWPLNGVNIMLAPISGRLELVWYNILLKVGLYRCRRKSFYSGPAFTAWWLMGNLEGWGGSVKYGYDEATSRTSKRY